MERNKIYFSIIIPTFNRARLIHNTIKSILDQRNILFELIIVDDGSEDNTSELILGLNDDRVKYVKTANRERGAARNSGLQVSKGVYVNYFDSDDILNPCLLDLYTFIVNNNSPDVVHGLMENISDEGSVIGIVRPAYSTFKKSILYNNFLACGSVFIKREIAHAFQFSEDRRLSGTEDWELWLRLYSNHDFIECPIVFFKQRQHALRSLHQVPTDRVTERESVFIGHINKERALLSKRFSKAEIDLLVADRYTLIALSQFEAGCKSKAFNYLIKSLNSSLLVIKRKRFLAVLKKLVSD